MAYKITYRAFNKQTQEEFFLTFHCDSYTIQDSCMCKFKDNKTGIVKILPVLKLEIEEVN